MTQTTAPWPEAMTRATGQAVRRYRTDPARSSRMTAEQLAAAVSALGLDYSRSQVANLEAGRRTSITVGEVLALAEALDVPPLMLLLPVGAAETMEYLPGRSASTWDVAKWVTVEGPPLSGERDESARYAEPVRLYREHDRQVADWRRWALHGERDGGGAAQDRMGAALEDSLRATRRVIRQLGLVVPELPAELGHVDEGRPW